MRKSTTKSRMKQRQLARRRKRRQRLFGVLFVMLMIGLFIIGTKSGLELSRSIKYPVEYSSYIVKYSDENDLDPYLVMAVIKQESNYIPDARSPYAGGLMQLTEETADDYAARLGMTDYDYMDPETNIKLGCYVLRSLIDKYEVVDTALAAYNAGMGNVDKWLNDPSYSSDGVHLSHIPFPETRHYVKKINGYWEDYKTHVDISEEVIQ